MVVDFVRVGLSYKTVVLRAILPEVRARKGAEISDNDLRKIVLRTIEDLGSSPSEISLEQYIQYTSLIREVPEALRQLHEVYDAFAGIYR